MAPLKGDKSTGCGSLAVGLAVILMPGLLEGTKPIRTGALADGDSTALNGQTHIDSD